jgi:hypothetical protein
MTALQIWKQTAFHPAHKLMPVEILTDIMLKIMDHSQSNALLSFHDANLMAAKATTPDHVKSES